MISSVKIRACAEAYSIPELETMLRDLLQKLQDPDMITSATTGGGTAYQRQQRVKIEDLIELYQATLDYKRHGSLPQSDITQFVTPYATH